MRTVKPEFWSDAKLAGVGMDVKAVYIGLWNEADDSGMLRWEPRQLAIDLMPDLREPEALRLLTKASRLLTRRGRLQRLDCGHAVIPTLLKHQKLAGDPGRRSYTHRREHDRLCDPHVPLGNPPATLAMPALGGEGRDSKGKGVSLVTNRTAREGAQSIGELMPDLKPELRH